MVPTSERATARVSVRGLCVTEWGNPPLSLALLYGDVQGKGGRERTGGLSQEGRGVPL